MERTSGGVKRARVHWTRAKDVEVVLQLLLTTASTAAVDNSLLASNSSTCQMPQNQLPLTVVGLFIDQV
eukprot:m.78248 g.78248  ORF g.78248 m.78248 type:complete len:69 (+) comp14497_c0_seq4:563-769(+)